MKKRLHIFDDVGVAAAESSCWVISNVFFSPSPRAHPPSSHPPPHHQSHFSYAEALQSGQCICLQPIRSPLPPPPVLCAEALQKSNTIVAHMLMGQNCLDALYHKQIENFVKWCDKHYLYLNVSKTKEMCIDFRKIQRCPKPVYIKGEAVERVETYKYLGVVFDSKLNWQENTSTQC